MVLDRAVLPLQVIDAARTDIGQVRASNEDAFVRRPEARLWAVADGMGGHDGGEWAADTIARCMADKAMTGNFDTDYVAAVESIREANRTIYNRARVFGRRIGSTVVAIVLGDERFAAIWAGDSRLYLQRAGRLTQVTRDHTHVQDRVERGLLSPDEARSHPMAHVLTRAVGVDVDIDLDSACGEVRPGDVFLLCSDGLHGVVAPAEIAEAMSVMNPAHMCETLLALSHARGSPDNVTLVAIACADPRSASLRGPIP